MAAEKAAADEAAAERKRAEKRDADLKWLADQGLGPDTIGAIAQLQQIHAARTDTSA